MKIMTMLKERVKSCHPDMSDSEAREFMESNNMYDWCSGSYEKLALNGRYWNQSARNYKEEADEWDLRKRQGKYEEINKAEL